jgi:hypothetical protein
MKEEIQPLVFLDRWKEFLVRNRLLILLSVSALFLSIALMLKLFKAPNYAEYAEREYRNFISTNDLSSLNKLASYVSRDRSLEAAYGAFLSRSFLERGEEKRGFFFLERSLEPLKEISPYHASFAEATLKIASEDWDAALGECIQLKNKMLSDQVLSKMEALYSSLLVRIALLEKKLGRSDQELIAWRDVENYSGLSSQEKGFIQERKKALEALQNP